MDGAVPDSPAARLAFALLLLTVALIPTPRLTGLGGPVQLSDLTLAVAAACFMAHWLSRRPPLRARPLLLPLGLYLAAAALSLVNAPHLGSSLRKIVGLGSLMVTLLLVVELLDRRRAELLADVWLVVVALLSLAVLAAVACAPDALPDTHGEQRKRDNPEDPHLTPEAEPDIVCLEVVDALDRAAEDTLARPAVREVCYGLANPPAEDRVLTNGIEDGDPAG